MRGDSKYILPLYAKMMGDEKIVDVVHAMPETLGLRDIRQLAMYGISVRRGHAGLVVKKSDVLDFILTETTEWIKVQRLGTFRAIRKILDRVAKFPEEEQQLFLDLMNAEIQREFNRQPPWVNGVPVEN